MTSKKLTPEEKNATMAVERAFLTKLLGAALQGDYAGLQQEVEGYCRQYADQSPQDVLTQCKDGQRRTVLHFACQSTNKGDAIAANKDTKEETARDGDCGDIVVKLLTQAKTWLSPSAFQTWIRAKDKDGLTPLMLAAQVSEPSLAEIRVKALLDASLDNSSNKPLAKLGLARSHTGATVLHYAAGAGATSATIRAIYEAGPVALSTFSRQGGTPLHWGCAHADNCSNSNDTIVALLDCGADWQAHISEPTMVPPPLILALAAGNLSHAMCLLQYVIEHDDIDVQSTLDFALPGNTSVLHMAADLDMVPVLQKLQELITKRHGDKGNKYWNATNDQGETPLDVAAREENESSVRFLLSLTSKKEGDYSTEAAREVIGTTKSKLTNKETTDTSERKVNATSAAASTDRIDEDDRDAAVGDSGLDSMLPNDIERVAKDYLSRFSRGVDTTSENKEAAQKLKAAGNTRFVNNEWQEALNCYTAAIDESPQEAVFYSNRSACHLNMKSAKAALFDAIVARNLDANWSKGAYRHAMALLGLELYEDAALAAWQGLQIDEENEELQRLLKKCVKLGRRDHQQKQKEKKEQTGNVADTTESTNP